MTAVGRFLAQNQVERFRQRIAASLIDSAIQLPAEEHRQRVAALLARLGDLDFYALLQVTPQASEEEVHRAYVEVARLLHPQHASRLALPAAEAALELLFERATEAYLTLSDPDRSQRYAVELGSRRSSTTAAGPRRDEERRREAGRQFRIAENLATDGRYHEAVQLLQQVVRLDPHSEYFALLAECLAHNPRWLARALEAAQGAVELDPENAALRVRVGHLQERRGDRTRAIARYREALDLDPRQVDAQAGVERLLPDLAGRRSAGRLRRLLSRLGFPARA